MKETVISYCSALLNTEDTELLGVLYDIVISEILDYCNIDTIPNTATSVICNMVCVQYSRRGNLGLQSQAYSGVSESFINGYPDNILKQLNRYRRISII